MGVYWQKCSPFPDFSNAVFTIDLQENNSMNLSMLHLRHRLASSVLLTIRPSLVLAYADRLVSFGSVSSGALYLIIIHEAQWTRRIVLCSKQLSLEIKLWQPIGLSMNKPGLVCFEVSYQTIRCSIAKLVLVHLFIKNEQTIWNYSARQTTKPNHWQQCNCLLPYSEIQQLDTVLWLQDRCQTRVQPGSYEKSCVHPTACSQADTCPSGNSTSGCQTCSTVPDACSCKAHTRMAIIGYPHFASNG